MSQRGWLATQFSMPEIFHQHVRFPSWERAGIDGSYTSWHCSPQCREGEVAKMVLGCSKAFQSRCRTHFRIREPQPVFFWLPPHFCAQWMSDAAVNLAHSVASTLVGEPQGYCFAKKYFFSLFTQDRDKIHARKYSTTPISLWQGWLNCIWLLFKGYRIKHFQRQSIEEATMQPICSLLNSIYE